MTKLKDTHEHIFSYIHLLHTNAEVNRVKRMKNILFFFAWILLFTVNLSGRY